MVGLETPKPRLASPTVAAPPLSRSTISRRSGWASAVNVSLAIVLTIVVDPADDERRHRCPSTRSERKRNGCPPARSCSTPRRSTCAAATSSPAGAGSCPGFRSRRTTRFETAQGTKSLADLFDGRSQLLVYHFMFGFGFRVDEQNPGCTGCSFVADHFDGVIPHLNGHDVTLVSESIAPLERAASVRGTDGLEVPLGLIARQRLQIRLRRGVHRGAAEERRRLQLQARRPRDHRNARE